MRPIDPARQVRSVRSAVGVQIERLIRDAAPGDKLPTERLLADQLGVSRSSVREALNELAQRRILDRSPGRGTTVIAPPEAARALADLHAAERVDVAELRWIVEPQIAGLAAVRATATDLTILEETLTSAHSGLTPSESLKLDMEFHRQLALASHNRLLVALCERINSWVADVRMRSHRTRVGRRDSVDGHRQILSAVAAGDRAAATRAMEEHLHEVARLIEESR